MIRPGSLLLTIAATCWISAHPVLGSGPPVGVVTSVLPIAYIVEEVGGERVRVDALVPPGASPHTFEPLPSDMVKLQGARYFIGVGGGFDGWSDKLLGAAPGSLEALTLITAPNLKLLVADHDHDHGERHASEKGEGFGAHFWLDPIRIRDAVVPVVMGHLIEADPAGKEHYRRRTKDFQERLTTLDIRIRRELARAKGRKFVAFHNSWDYFSARYNLEEVGVVQEFAGEEPTPREVAGLVRGARAAGIRSILVEPQLSPRIAQTIANEFGAGTVIVDPLGDSGDPARSSYEKLMLFNARAFAQALGGKRN